MTKRQRQEYLSLFVFVSVKSTNANLSQHSSCSKEHNRAKRHCFHVNSIIGIKSDHYILIFIIFAFIKEIHICRSFLTSRFGLSEPSSSDIIPPIFAFSLAWETIRIIRSIELSSTWIFIFIYFWLHTCLVFRDDFLNLDLVISMPYCIGRWRKEI